MQTGAKLEERRIQKAVLKYIFDDYDPVRHDVYVCEYNKAIGWIALHEYNVNRNLEPERTELIPEMIEWLNAHSHYDSLIMRLAAFKVNFILSDTEASNLIAKWQGEA